jgi:hypothetical protein
VDTGLAYKAIALQPDDLEGNFVQSSRQALSVKAPLSLFRSKLQYSLPHYLS